MPPEQPVPFHELIAVRRQLQIFCQAHSASLLSFQSGFSFKLYPTDPEFEDLRHLSSSATCLESLLDCENTKRAIGKFPTAVDFVRNFSVHALLRPPARWTSDGSAPIYCRCRTLPVVIAYLEKYPAQIEAHLEFIFDQLDMDPTRLSIGEASDQDPKNWYPPNAFHTYWILQLLHVLGEKWPNAVKTLKQNKKFDLTRLPDAFLLWARKTAGLQIALHTADSSTLDSDQLAWSLAIIMKFGRDFHSDLAQQDFLRCGLKCLFEAQTKAGIWRTGSPLFHYSNAGNAHCYVFETFSILLKGVLTSRKEGAFLREILRPYLPQLIKLWHYAETTAVPLEGENTFGWSSGHRVNRREPESWATASVYAYAQGLRRLVGIWAREAAATPLRVVKLGNSQALAVTKLSERGDTWTTDRTPVAAQLMKLFVNPAAFYGSGDYLQPDSQPIRENQARGAILFGPPGASKTTLARAVAEAIGWDFLELHASHFVAEGLPNVQRTANEIFDRLLELDRTVIFFDEIDELVRTREGDTSVDAFGRFLTTSMLPKLAELWQRRKVIYFIATNHIRFFDPAITRAQRFDALIRVSPPAFKRKCDGLKKILNGLGVEAEIKIRQKEVDAEMARLVGSTNGEESKSEPLPDTEILAKFRLLRWDQLDELAYLIVQKSGGKRKVRLTRDLFAACLKEIRDPALKDKKTYRDYNSSGNYKQYDFSKVQVWRVQEPPDPKRKKLWGDTVKIGADGKAYLFERDLELNHSVRKRFEEESPGILRERRKKAQRRSDKR